jgi:2-hydroxy-3-oxopropionate reductase
VIEAIKGGAAQCWTLDVKPPACSQGNRQPGFKAHMQAKDMNIILETAREYGIPLPSAAVDSQLFNAMVENGLVAATTPLSWRFLRCWPACNWTKRR